MSRWRVGAVAAVAAAVLAVVAVLAFAGSGATPHEDTTPSRFSLPALGGGANVELASFRGTPVVVNLFASWCEECRRELPAFAAEAARLRGRVTFVGVNSEETGDGRAMASEFHLAASGFVLARDPTNRFHQALRAPGMPVTVFYAADGSVITRDIAAVGAATLRDQLHRYYGV